MQFPAYVPAAAGRYLAAMIDGTEFRSHGWATSLEECKQEVIEIEQAIERSSARGEVDYLVHLNQQRIKAVEQLRICAGEVNCLRRLIHDDRMRDAYALLTYEIIDDEQWRCFVDAAWAARGDFGDYRERLKKAKEQKMEIADTATKLARQLEEFSQIGITGPDEFYSVRDLLRKTDSEGINSQNWKAMRKHVVGDKPQQDRKVEKQLELDLPLSELERELETEGLINYRLNIQFVSPGDVREQDPLAGLRYGWEKAPPLSALLKTVAKAGRDFDPTQDGMIGAALVSRQGSVKSEYLRAFAYLLFRRHKFNATTGVMRAMAITSNVVINRPDVDFTYDDVRKALLNPNV